MDLKEVKVLSFLFSFYILCVLYVSITLSYFWIWLHECKVICVQLVFPNVCIDPRPGWEACFLPAWLINGVVMAIGQNEGMKRRRSASWPGTHTFSSTNANSQCTHFGESC